MEQFSGKEFEFEKVVCNIMAISSQTVCVSIGPPFAWLVQGVDSWWPASQLII